MWESLFQWNIMKYQEKPTRIRNSQLNLQQPRGLFLLALSCEHCWNRTGFYMSWQVMWEKGTRSESILGKMFGDTVEHPHRQACMERDLVSPRPAMCSGHQTALNFFNTESEDLCFCLSFLHITFHNYMASYWDLPTGTTIPEHGTELLGLVRIGHHC